MPTARERPASLLILTLAVMLLGCGPRATTGDADGGAPSDGTGCSRVLPSCPTPAPSFSQDVGQIFAMRCAPCHSSAGPEPTKPLTSYAQIYKLRGQVLVQVHACLMPPPDAGALPEETATEVMTWLVCGAPNN